MSGKISRREFMVTGTAGLAAAAQAPTMITPTTVKPVVISIGEWAQYAERRVRDQLEKAFGMMTSGADVLESLIAGVNIVELDPSTTASATASERGGRRAARLRAACTGREEARRRRRRARRRQTPSLVACDAETDHHLLVGKGAQDFARAWLRDPARPEHRRVAQGLIEWKRRSDRSISRSTATRRCTRS